MARIPRLPAMIVGGLLMATGGCAPGEARVAESPTPPARPTAPTPAAEPAVAESFEEWRETFRARALAQGIRGDVFDSAFAGVGVNAKVLELDAFQPEFTKPIWEYLDTAVSDTRVANGQAKAALHANTLSRIGATYGVDTRYVVAIWGLESAYGANFGSIPVVESLATLAYEGRRRSFGEEQLIAALKIIQAGDIAAERMVGSWAGAMGHTQFIPTSFLAYAVDFTGDGRRDVWASDPADALASTANYLAKFGWRKGAPVVAEVVLPAGFDYLMADGSTKRDGSAWAALGLAAAGGGAIPSGEATLIVPAGANGPAFLAYHNFNVIKRYNNATSYAMAVSMLGDAIEGRGRGVVQAWPRGDRPLSRSETQELQTLLTALGYDTKGVDGIVGPNSRTAIRSFQRAKGLVPDGYVSQALLDAVRAAGG